MKFLETVSVLIFAATCAVFPAQAELTAEEETIASDMWASAYAWLQTGKNLSEHRQWPLALASYTESLKQFKAVVDRFPEYEPEILAYRMKKLTAAIEDAETKLEGSDHEISMLYLDAIEMIEKGENLRFIVRDFEESYKSLQEAKAVLGDLIAKRPEKFSIAMKSQVDRIQSHLTWLGFELGYAKRPGLIEPADLPSPPGSGGRIAMNGTTEFVRESDLPTVDSGVKISSALFPAPAEPASVKVNPGL